MIYYKPYNFRIETDPDAKKALKIGKFIAGAAGIGLSCFFAPAAVPEELKVFTEAAAASFILPVVIPDSSDKSCTSEKDNKS